MVHDGLDAADHGIAAVFPDHLEEAALAGLHRRDLGAEIAHRPLRQAHVGLDDRDQLLVRHAFAVDLHDRHLQAFGEDVGGGAVERAADVGPVRHAAGERHQLAVMEDRHREGHVVEMAAGDVGVVGEQDVARLEILDAVMIELGLHGVAHAADEHRQSEPDRHRVALRVEQADGEVERLVDDHVVGGAHQVGLHLLGRGDETVAHDLGGHGIGAMAAERCLGLARARPCSAPQNLDDQVAEGVDLDDVAGMNDGGRGIFLDQRRPGDAIPGKQRCAVIGRRVEMAAGFGEIDRPGAAKGRSRRLGRRRRRSRSNAACASGR